ncbi:hypothetical protein [Encephalitozoon cuniculi GB-M1]|uniref:Uncharacterized protein n=2 Tax=Encephalitozoon cuniculi TaxID=6035 RepID=Q8SUK7_ENCCU|nr:uncharacterized protein ECU08_1670 [Encephalitozoon cuniculi GB-M1]AGE95177.1 hypothetical protein ECU08_1670 [Encephalitozoon cuniculi]KMV65694.1 hypothetical protein M970_081690 [Encephalitozoon cuniculi EcunIII-L]UYI27100.1 hypothetical protein J0A71_04g09500 [Encephalitozoon cuniculi]CAD26471.1 hypothetical protein [Encephalitozoon cuniculi GB-M1]
MEKIDLDDVDDAILREKLFVKAATRFLKTMEFKGVEEGYDGELMRPQKEVEQGDADAQRKSSRMARKHSEMRLKRKSEDVDLDSEDLGPEDFIAPMLSNRETRKKNKEKHPVNRSLKRRRMKKRQKRHRR